MDIGCQNIGFFMMFCLVLLILSQMQYDRDLLTPTGHCSANLIRSGRHKEAVGMVSLAVLLFVFLIQLLCNMEFPLFSVYNLFCSMTIYLIIHSEKWKVFDYILPEQVFKGRVRHCKITTFRKKEQIYEICVYMKQCLKTSDSFS